MPTMKSDITVSDRQICGERWNVHHFLFEFMFLSIIGRSKLWVSISIQAKRFSNELAAYYWLWPSPSRSSSPPSSSAGPEHPASVKYPQSTPELRSRICVKKNSGITDLPCGFIHSAKLVVVGRVLIRKIEWSWYIQSELIAGKKIASVWLWHRKLCLPILSAKSVMEGCHVTSCLQRGGNTLLYKQQSYDKLASPYYLLKYIN